jgi:hypothetical protein
MTTKPRRNTKCQEAVGNARSASHQREIYVES